MTGRILSVSAAPYDGYDPPELLDSLAAVGATHVEPAFIVGYTEPFDEDVFSDAAAVRWAAWLDASGVGCHAMSCHIDLGRADARTVFPRRMDFARRLGARVINTNAAVRDNELAFFRNIEPLARHAESLSLAIGLENPGDARPSLIDRAADGVALVARIGSPQVRLNYDPGNLASHRPALDPIADALVALPACVHLHLKSVGATAEGWHHLAFGEGALDHRPLLDALRDRPALPVSLEMPLRMRRGPDAQPWRRVARLERSSIEEKIRLSLDVARRALSPS